MIIWFKSEMERV